MSTISPDLQRRISAATTDLADAEQQLKKVLDAIETTVRADKKIIGPALEAAFSRVVAAKTTLASALEDGAR